METNKIMYSMYSQDESFMELSNTYVYENDVLSVLMCLAIRFLGVNYLEGQEWVTS